MSKPRPFRLTAPEPDEDCLHASVAAALNTLLLPPAQWTTFPAGGYGLSPAAAARLYRLGLKPGWPDILVCHDGRLYGLELKTRDGRLSTTRMVHTRSGAARVRMGQREMLAGLERAGVRIAVCRDVLEVLETLRRWDVPLRHSIAA